MNTTHLHSRKLWLLTLMIALFLVDLAGLVAASAQS